MVTPEEQSLRRVLAKNKINANEARLRNLAMQSRMAAQARWSPAGRAKAAAMKAALGAGYGAALGEEALRDTFGQKGREQAAMNVGEFAGMARVGQDFTPEQNAMRQIMGHGEKIWGFEESQVVTIHNDLNPGMRGDDNTASLFGFGGKSERSGLF